MLEAGVQVGLFRQRADAPEVRVVDVSINSEQALEDCLHDCQEVWWKRLPIPGWEESLVVQLHKSCNLRIRAHVNRVFG